MYDKQWSLELVEAAPKNQLAKLLLTGSSKTFLAKLAIKIVAVTDKNSTVVYVLVYTCESWQMSKDALCSLHYSYASLCKLLLSFHKVTI